MASEIRKEIRIRDRLRKKYITNKIGRNERKYKNQRNKVNNLGGGGRTLKNCAERREARKFWGISCEKSRFYALKEMCGYTIKVTMSYLSRG
jgi:hypothetical protein